MDKVIENTESICPVCKTVIEAKIIEENGSAYMVKECAMHGSFKAMVSKYAWYYKGLNTLHEVLFPTGHSLNDKTIRALQFYPTSECNLSCPMCYAYAPGMRCDYSLEEIRRIANSIQGKKTIHMFGGEPTMREDIFQVVKAFKDAGHFVGLYTNGIKIQDVDYLRRLKKSGIGTVHIGVDSLSDEHAYCRLRGERLLEIKKKALHNLKALKVKTGIIDTLCRNATEKYIAEIMGFARKNRFVYEVSIRGYSHIGRLGFSRNEEFTMDELAEVFEKETKGLVTLEEFYVFQQITYILKYILYKVPLCYVLQHIFVPRQGKKLRDIFPPDIFAKHITIFKDMLRGNPAKARIFFLRKLFSRIPRGFPLFGQRTLKGMMPFLDARYYLTLEFAMFYTPYTLDLNKTRNRCVCAWLPSYAQGKMEDYCGMLARTTPIA